MGTKGPLPEHILNKMSAEDRMPHGKAGMTVAEIDEKTELKREKEIQREISTYLRLKEIEFINPPMHKRSMLPEGWPDFTGCHIDRVTAWDSKPWAVEIKIPGKDATLEQAIRIAKLTNLGWTTGVAHSLSEFKQITGL